MCYVNVDNDITLHVCYVNVDNDITLHVCHVNVDNDITLHVCYVNVDNDLIFSDKLRKRHNTKLRHRACESIVHYNNLRYLQSCRNQNRQ